jgi:hypothetical protein
LTVRNGDKYPVLSSMLSLFVDSKALLRANMKISIASTLFSASLAAASPHFGAASLDNWKPAGHGDCASLSSLLYYAGKI